MSDVGERDRWLIDGDCSKCRRSNYCSKECKLHRAHRKREMWDTINRVTGFDKVFDAMSTRNYDGREHAEDIARIMGVLED